MKNPENLPPCLVGRDDDNNSNDTGLLIAFVLAMIVLAMMLAIMIYGGAFIGGYHSLKNYVIAFKRNVIDSNAGVREEAV